MYSLHFSVTKRNTLEGAQYKLQNTAVNKNEILEENKKVKHDLEKEDSKIKDLTSNKKINHFCDLTFSYSISRIQTSTVSKPTPTPAARTNVSNSRPKAPLLGRKMVSGMSPTKFSRLF